VKRRFRLTPEAVTDIRELFLGVAADSLDRAERLRSEFYEALQRLGQSPGIGHFHEELLDRRYRFWNFYSYVVCYVWQKKPIQIIAVVHGARDLAAFFTTRTS
jgi:plasmid stabilization system protein ParE